MMRVLFAIWFLFNTRAAGLLMKMADAHKMIASVAYLYTRLPWRVIPLVNDSNIYIVCRVGVDGPELVPGLLHDVDKEAFIRQEAEQGRTVLYCENIHTFRWTAMLTIQNYLEEQENVPLK